MDYMFFAASAFNQPLNSWDVSKVTNMSAMFYSASAFNQPLNSWDVSKVTNMNSMFLSAKAFNQNLSGWKTTVLMDGKTFAPTTFLNANLPPKTSK